MSIKRYREIDDLDKPMSSKRCKKVNDLSENIVANVIPITKLSEDEGEMGNEYNLLLNDYEDYDILFDNYCLCESTEEESETSVSSPLSPISVVGYLHEEEDSNSLRSFTNGKL